MKRFSKKSWVLVAGVVAAAAFASTAAAVVNFDPTCSFTPSNSTGACGFVGKGDVQTALGWNNYDVQNNSIDFTYSATGNVLVTCKPGENSNVNAWKTGTFTGEIGYDIAYTGRSVQQISGFLLNSLGDATLSDGAYVDPSAAFTACVANGGTLVYGTPELTGDYHLYVNGALLQ